MAIQTALRICWSPATQHTPDARTSPTSATLLTHATQALAQVDLCVDAFIGYGAGTANEEPTIICLPTNISTATAALQKAGLQVQSVPLVVAWLPDTMLSLACACEVIETANVHIDLACLIRRDSGQGQKVAFLCDDAELADRLLWAQSY
jgi:hypothetical protein